MSSIFELDKNTLRKLEQLVQSIDITQQPLPTDQVTITCPYGCSGGCGWSCEGGCEGGCQASCTSSAE